MRIATAASWLCVVGLLGSPGGASAGATGEVRGHVSLGVEGLPLAAVAPVVVHLEAIDGSGPGPPPGGAATMTQRGAHFEPPFLVVAAGQSVEMDNDDEIYHNVFSYSRPNDFDLGLYPGGESRTLTLHHAGLVKIYCSIHESMNATILVAPTRWFDAVSASGAYAIRGVPVGRYRAVVWSERLPETVREIDVVAGAPQRIDWVIGAPSSTGSAYVAPRTRVASSAGRAAAIRKP